MERVGRRELLRGLIVLSGGLAMGAGCATMRSASGAAATARMTGGKMSVR
jgi:hypothetical protein